MASDASSSIYTNYDTNCCELNCTCNLDFLATQFATACRRASDEFTCKFCHGTHSKDTNDLAFSRSLIPCSLI
eukprot:3337119-Amphidinium_carterae.1